MLQADQASAKGIETIVLNEDTTKTTDLWKRVRTTAAMVYMSPEMALSETFHRLWKDSHFRKRLTAVIIDEAHCIDEWGNDEFCPLYRKLNTLRNYTGYEIPVVSCTATARTLTFDLIWSTVGYGNRPFWGLDVGDRCLRKRFNHIEHVFLGIWKVLKPCSENHSRWKF